MRIGLIAMSGVRVKSGELAKLGVALPGVGKWWAREDLHLQGSQTLDLRGLLFPLNHSPEIKPQTSTSKFQGSSNAQDPEPVGRIFVT